MAVTRFALSTGNCKCISIVARQTAFTVISTSVVDALQTFPCATVTVGNSIGINIVVAYTFLARLGWRVAIVTISTEVTPVANIALFAIHTGYLPTQKFNTGSVIRARTGLAVILGSSQCVTIETRGTTFTVLTDCVVLADTATCINIAGIRVAITVAGDALGKGATSKRVTMISWGTRLTELAHIALWTSTLFHMANFSGSCRALPR